MTTCYNASKYIKKCIDSVKQQTYKNYIMVIVDDVSTDNSVDIIKNEILGFDNIHLIENKSKMYAPGNHFTISKLSFVEPNDILICLDGDDWFPNEFVLDRVFGYYYMSSTLMTFGQFVHYDGKTYYPGFTSEPKFEMLRKTRWTTSHLKTFKAKVFNKIKDQDLVAICNRFLTCSMIR
jgi:glycosyltransferase involved in cell wall biosynthesis